VSTHGHVPDVASGRILVRSLGCKVSRIDAAALGTAAGSRGGDVVVIHTCSVTDRADRDGRKMIRRLRRENPRATLVVTGCLAQRDPQGLAAMPEVDLVVGHGAVDGLGRLLSDREAGLLPGKVAWTEAPRGPLLFAGPGDGSAPPLLDAGRTRAFLKVQDGCERRCSFCIVPSLRGAERSADPGAVEEAIHRLGESGVGEVVLAGVHLSNFGTDRGTSLVDLLRRLEQRPPRARVRLSSLEPMEAGEALVDLVAASAVVVPHLHLPLQSGSPAVLRRMRRGITPRRFESLAGRAVRANPRLHLATDLIAGFPGETAEEFEETRGLVERLPFASLHVFPFSARSGTDAALRHLQGGVPPEEITRRARLLRALAGKKARAFRDAAAGTEAEVVVLRDGRALTDNYLEVRLAPELLLASPGSRLIVRLGGGDAGSLVAGPLLDSPTPVGALVMPLRAVADGIDQTR
jgi:threonylcarbamoyladenosine tRNA methylthiotransferase MtaB